MATSVTLLAFPGGYLQVCNVRSWQMIYSFSSKVEEKTSDILPGAVASDAL